MVMSLFYRSAQILFFEYMQKRGKRQNKVRSVYQMIKKVIKDDKIIINGSSLYFKFRIRALPIINQFKETQKIPMERIQVECFICGNISCLEDTDHKKLTFPQFDSFLRTKAGYEPQISKIKHKIRKCFRSIKQQCNQNLQPFVVQLMLMVDKLHFWHIMKFTDSLSEIEAAIFGFMLPRKKMIKLLNILSQQADHTIKFPKFDKLLSQIHKFKKNSKKIIQHGVYGQLATKFASIIQQCQKNFIREKSCPEQHQKVISINAGIPTKKEEPIMGEFTLLEGVPFSTLRRSVDLSVLELTDAVFLNSFSNLQKMNDLKQIQMRNSRLSETCYRMLFNALPNLQSIDLSGSNCDNFFQILGTKLPKLKTLYLNEVSLTDQKFYKIIEPLNNIRVIYADENMLTSQSMQYLYKNKKQIMFVSAKGNSITPEVGIKIQVNLVIKGGYLEY